MTERAAPPPQATGSRRNPLALRHPLVGHDVQRPAADPRLGRLLRRTPARHPVPEDRLHAEHRRLAPATARGSPTPPSTPTDRSAGCGAGSHPGPAGGRRCCHAAGSSHPAGAGSPPGPTGPPGRRTPPAGRTPHPPAALSIGLSTCSSRAGTVSASVTPGSRHHRRLDLVRLRVDGQVELQPGPPLGVAVLADLPLALAVDLQPGAVEDQVERPFGPLRQRDPDGGRPGGRGWCSRARAGPPPSTRRASGRTPRWPAG